MEYKYIDRANETGLAKTGLSLAAVLAVGLIPTSNYIIPHQKQTLVNYTEFAETNTQTVAKTCSQVSENEQSEILISFASNLSKNTKDLDTDIAQIISNDFWEMYD